MMDRTNRRLSSYSGVGVLSDIVNLTASTPTRSQAGNGRSKKGKGSESEPDSSFGLAADLACFQPPKPKRANMLDLSGPKTVCKPFQVAKKKPTTESTRNASRRQPGGGCGVDKPAASKSAGVKRSARSVKKAQDAAEGADASNFTPPHSAEPDTSFPILESDDEVEKKVKLACDSTRKKRNRRKTVCFGDWVTGTPPPALKNRAAKASSREVEPSEDPEARSGEGDLVATPPRQTVVDSCGKNGGAKTPSHAEILKMSKELNSLANNLLPETPGTTEKAGRQTLKERLAESWCGKSYYERLAEVTSNGEGAVQDEEEGEETLDNLQSKLEEALKMTKSKKAKKAKGDKKISARTRRRKTMSFVSTRTITEEKEQPKALDLDSPIQATKKECEEDVEERRKSWADVVADKTEETELVTSEEADEEAKRRKAKDAKKDDLIRKLRAELDEATRKSIVLECQKEQLEEEKSSMKSSLDRLKSFATQLTQQVLELNSELDTLSARCT
ncbi:hypothetical protein HOP50_05g39320 [Chloropicon primus]|uniref:Uncharacterized protein n=1 Tax=Chloropicon primus TaxID=1764295 RepID=A0A5B8MLQ0_9CHLO|nr:hypothetical protein A3770_05p39210 [Chloropicon primus]UPR00617.1 hypothetical protein HOP50_05g39320 [Chloropicon primus]|mmetsp:Transcript_2690/g.7374  ORF Transcript_2690/g.7374 Transcript_2690/m.7374 type:complete len:504 (-) Transcript_2690:93-1604(-)|eukprot:QDZ21403.1 hypothetical protein A3770_05p39210 [Chloropicon primus]